MTRLKTWACACGAAVLMIFGAQAQATPLLDLFDWEFNVDGSVYCPDAGCPSATLPASVNGSGFDFGPGGLDGTGLGTITASFSGTGSHYFGAFLDHDIDEPTNTYFNEYGQTGGTPGTGQSWEIDEPGYVFGDIVDNLAAGTLDNSNSIPSGSPDDVSMALGWDFTLNAGETATISLLVSQVQPTAGFYLQQVDPDSNVNLYYSSVLNVKPAQASGAVPEPGTLLLMGSGLVGLYQRRRGRRTVIGA